MEKNSGIPPFILKMLYRTLVHSLCNFIQIARRWSCTHKKAKICCSKAQIRI